MRDNDFKNRLAEGQKYENLLVNILNSYGVNAKLNNSEEVKDIDIELIDDDIYIDSKLAASTYKYSYNECGIKPEDCLLINVNHVMKYDEKEKSTGKKSWVAFHVKFKEYNINELVFVPNSYLVYVINSCRSGKMNRNRIYQDKKGVYKLRVNKQECRSLPDFLFYIGELRKIKQFKN